MLRYKSTIFRGIGSQIEKPISTASLYIMRFICTLVLTYIADSALQIVLRMCIQLLDIRMYVCVFNNSFSSSLYNNL